MASLLRGVGLLATVLMLSACGQTGIGITSGDWDKVYRASLAYENAMGIARRSAQTWQTSKADRDRFEATRQQVGQLTSEAQAAMDAASDCTSTSTGQVCAAVKSLRDTSGGSLMAKARTGLSTTDTALSALQNAHNAVVDDYNQAGTSWNAWVRTLMMIVANGDQVSAWPNFAERRDEALAAAEGFAKSGDDQKLADRANAFSSALKPLNDSVLALSQVIVAARGQLPETVATGAPGPGTATGIAQTQTGSSVTVGDGFSIDPTGIVTQWIQSMYQLQQARETSTREKLLGQFQNMLWPDYNCFETPTPACPGFVPARPGSSSLGGQTARSAH